ncbi:MAG: nucleotidyltransferase family protein [Pseudomonadota bacterium]
MKIPKQAMILAAGLGKRMRPLTDNIPKPMIEVGGKTIIDHAIDRLCEINIEKIVINTSYKAEIIEEHLSKRKFPEIIFSREEEPLETGGGIAKALHNFGNENFFCVNGDVIWFDNGNNALHRLAESINNNLDAVLLLHPKESAIGYEGQGDFFCDESGVLQRRESNEEAPFIYTGIQILNPRLFCDSPKGAFSLNILYNKAISHNTPRIKGIIHQGDLLNVGDVRGKILAEEYMVGFKL